jgi:hypothetical protein
MAKTAQQVVDMAKVTLLESGTGIRWTETELLGYLNDGQREIVKLKPDANAVHAAVQMVAGTKQSLPSAAISLIELARNLGTDGTTPGAAIRPISRQTLDMVLPNWHAAAVNTKVEYYCFDERDPKVFWVFPPQPASGQGYVEQVRADNPADCVLADPLALGDEYANDLYHFILHRAFAKETEEGSPARAAGYLQAFMQGLGVAELAEQKTQPRTARRPQ